MNKQLNLIDTLLRTYAVVMIIIITLFTFLVGYTTFQQFVRDAVNENEQTARLLTETLTNTENQTSRIVHDLVSTREDITNLQDYFELDHPSYLKETLKRSGEQRYLPQMITQLYQEHNDIGGIGIVFESYESVFYSDGKKKGGEKRGKLPNQPNQLMISKPIIDAESLTNLGTFYFILDQEKIGNLLKSSSKAKNQEVLIFSATNQLMSHYQGGEQKYTKLEKLIDKDVQSGQRINNEKILDNYYTTEVKTNGELTIIALTSKKAIYQEAFANYFWVLVGSLLLDGILLILLFRTFSGYSKQVEDILDSMYAVADGDLSVRIEESNKRREIKAISHGINQMLDSINQYVKDIYLLEIEQQDAHMKALQAQINPHFLYNTLEYIRMYAVSEGVPELADVVYAFASLLRNNTTQEKVILLHKELEFCEKYVYLFQMRYPDRVAYHFTIDNDLDDVKIPKFLIQPIIENYFVHGIDFTRLDNALSVKVYQNKGIVTIDVSDNGHGISHLDNVRVNQKLSSNVEQTEIGKSIGLSNIYQRLKLIFGPESEMFVGPSESGGVLVRMTFREENGNV